MNTLLVFSCFLAFITTSELSERFYSPSHEASKFDFDDSLESETSFMNTNGCFDQYFLELLEVERELAEKSSSLDSGSRKRDAIEAFLYTEDQVLKASSVSVPEAEAEAEAEAEIEITSGSATNSVDTTENDPFDEFFDQLKILLMKDSSAFTDTDNKLVLVDKQDKGSSDLPSYESLALMKKKKFGNEKEETAIAKRVNFSPRSPFLYKTVCGCTEYYSYCQPALKHMKDIHKFDGFDFNENVICIDDFDVKKYFPVVCGKCPFQTNREVYLRQHYKSCH